MKVKVRAITDDAFLTILNRLKSKKLAIQKEDKKWKFIVADVPFHSAGVLFEILELNGVVERDVRNDLD